MPVIICEIKLTIKWSPNFVIKPSAINQNTTLPITLHFGSNINKFSNIN